MQDYEQKNMKLPEWYKGWSLANNLDISERPPEFVYYAIKARK